MNTLFNMTFTFDQLLIAMGITALIVSACHIIGFTLIPDKLMLFILAQRNTRWYALASTVLSGLIVIASALVILGGIMWIVFTYAPMWMVLAVGVFCLAAGLFVIGAVVTSILFKFYKNHQ